MDDAQGKELELLVQERLKGLHRHLQIVHAGIVVAAAALHHQNVERDEEIARVLEHCVGERLFHQIERTAELIAAVRRAPGGFDATWDLESGARPRR